MIGPGEGRTTHACGACGARLFTARFSHTGTLVHVERAPRDAGNLILLPDLPGIADGQLPHVSRSRQRRSVFREHACPKVKAFWSSSAQRKVRQ